MERGVPDLTVYTFEVPDGQHMAYPDNELWTLDFNETDAYAREKGYQLIGWDLEMDDSDLIEDYTPQPECFYCGLKLNESDTGFWVDPDYPESSDEARYCDESPDHLHHDKEIS